MLREVLPANPFYARKYAAAGIALDQIRAPEDLSRLPFTTKAELLADQAAHPPYGSILTYPIERYSRLHQTSGTSGRPLCWLDTPASWQRLLGCWDVIFQTVGLCPGDRLFFPFSFGPFLGFWTAFEAGARQGYLCLAGGGMSTGARLRFLLEHRATIVFCTPTYAVHMAQAARDSGVDLKSSSVRALIVAGEPGGSIPATRALIENAWGARVFDHSGLTEVGPLTIECQQKPAGLHVIEDEYVAEIIEPETGQAVPPGNIGELVLTNLHRWGSPLIRYRTGDLVRADVAPCPCGRTWLRLDGGILGRVDDMIHLRGNNFYPSALEGIIRRFPEVAEYRVEVDQTGSLADLRIDVEPVPNSSGDPLAEMIARAIRDELLFRADVKAVPSGTLPRFELKARRIVWKKSSQ